MLYVYVVSVTIVNAVTHHLQYACTSQMKLRAEGAPVKPLTTYMLFLADMRPKIMEKHPDITVGGIARIVSEKFRALSEKKKAMYKARSAAAMEEYHAKMSAFRWVPPTAALFGWPRTAVLTVS